METTPITGLDELDKHLDDLLQDASLALNPKLFDDVELQLTETNIPPLIPRFLPRLTALLKQYPQDPAVIVSLTVMLLGPLPFDDVFSIAESDDLVEALDSPAPSANLLVLSILHKATLPRHISFFCMDTNLVFAFIRRWLASPQVEVGQKAGKVLGDLLDIDCPLPPPPPPTRPVDASHADLTLRKAPGHGTLWNLVFNDRRMYTLLLDLIAGRHPDTAGDPHQLSLAQGRVLRILPRLAAINFRAVSHSHMTAPTPVHFTNGNEQCTDGEEQPPPSNPNPPRPGEGLLQYAALRMVQKSDTLMHLSLVDFFETLVSLLRVTEDSTLKTETLRAMLGEATGGDAVLRDALLSLPERTVEVEAEDLRRWLREVMPGETVGLAVR
ncbi:hypothetical protein C8A01DRAFT_18476 [Parachaetomium inaequale]|uniref:DNA mismatch repair protein HSM3 N-terminal domain-containing protein n=1 Tax=Parachaetomium inaequale TaxID=2588326 RepID=A0AAN6PDJ1_9PEZI|nr:hypothetical protein C8A01DRAFT_18476 [Parachaetomium inaequale]